MKYRYTSVKLILFAVFFPVFSCAGFVEVETAGTAGIDSAARESPSSAESGDDAETLEEAPAPGEPDYPVPEGFVFIPADFPSLEVPRGVGVITGARGGMSASLDREERAALSGFYRNAYIDGLLRDAPLAGVLGGDMVHGWPENAPGSWAQNWRSSAPAGNSWGIPDLILAVIGTGRAGAAGAEEETRDRVFTVEGKILDFYGRSAGINNANGEAGYGSPRGYSFPLNNGIAQRFDLGLIIADAEGRGSFRAEVPPSLREAAPSDTGIFTGVPDGLSAPARDRIRSAFISARKTAMDCGVEIMVPDGPGQYIELPKDARALPGGEVPGLYVQSFNREGCLLVLPDTSLLPPHPRLIGAPFLDALLAPPGEQLRSGDGSLAGALTRGISRYGVPLTDPVPCAAALPGKQPAQRFSRGWLTLAPGDE